MLTLHLNTGWTCEYFEIEPDLYEFQDLRVQIARLTDWRFPSRYAEGWAAWLERAFQLHPQAECVRYHLLLDYVPAQTRLSINGETIGIVRTPVQLDITDRVALGDNRIAFRVEAGADGTFGSVRLQAVPCDSA